MKKSQLEPRTCPVCSVELKSAERQGVRIDECPNCRGVWMDRTELDKVIERANAESSRPELSGAVHLGATEEWSHLHPSHGTRNRGFLSDLFS
ncbi:MAG TPA: zf-TFIIB domain-containing protein [bacterium]|jgi:hypothetical protein